MRHDQHPDPGCLVGFGHALHPGRIRRHVVGELLEVLGGHRAAARAQQQWAARLGVGQRLRLRAADRRRAVLHPGHVRDAGLQHPHLAAGDVADLATARPVGLEPEHRTRRRDGAVCDQGAVRAAYGRPELHLAGVRVDPEVPIVRTGEREVAHLLPALLLVVDQGR